MLRPLVRVAALAAALDSAASFSPVPSLPDNAVGAAPASSRLHASASASASASEGGDPAPGRRAVLLGGPAVLMGAAASLSLPPAAAALDMDAFASSQLAKEEPKYKDLSEDEALCKYGSAGPDKGSACQRAGMSTAGKGAKGVDAFGNIDRGDFVRCKREWKVIDGKYEKFDICK